MDGIQRHDHVAPRENRPTTCKALNIVRQVSRHEKGVALINGHTHLLGGLAAGAIAAPALALGHVPAFLIAAMLAGPLADIDHPGSMYGKWLPFPGVAQVGGHIEPYRGGFFGHEQHSFGHVGRTVPFAGVVWHRGPSHSLAAAGMAAILSFIAAFVATVHGSLFANGGLAGAIALGVLVGYLSHLFLDAFNIMGQELLWPFSRRRFKVGPLHIPVGSLGETMAVVALVGVLFLTMPHLFPALFGQRLFGGGAPWIP